MYSGFELCEAAALPGREEYLDSEKYEIRPRDFSMPGNIVAEITKLNWLRRAEPALQSHTGITFYNAFNDNILYFGKHAPGEASRILVAVNLDPHNAHACDFEIPLWEWGLGRSCGAGGRGFVARRTFHLDRQDPASCGFSPDAALCDLARETGKGEPEMARRKPSAVTPDPQWYKDAVIYQLHVKSFFDSNNDGIGDFPGLIEKLDYLAEIGVTAIWLLPFYPSPRRDDGYDISEYRGVHPEYGNIARCAPLHRGSPCARPARHHRTGDQPHLRPASLVPARAQGQAGFGGAQFLCLVRRRQEIYRHAHHLHRHREIELDLGRRSQGLLLASLLFTPAGPELRQSARLRRSDVGAALLARHGRRRAAAGCRALSGRARRHQQRKSAGDARHPEAHAAV